MDKTRNDLYNEFRKSITNPSGIPFFDESDLVEIFDYAGDQGDDATRAEVIAMASRLYPDSDSLKVRKALYYYGLGSYDMAEAMANAPHVQNPLWDILAVKLAEPSGDEGVERLKAILDRYPRLDDEAIIQFVNLANTIDQLPWVIEHIDELRTKTDYAPTLLYEIAVLASMHNDNDTVIRLVDELTSLEPFYPPYWIMLARAYGDKSEYDNALNAVDYALAIENDNAEALAVKVQLLLLCDKDVSEILPQFRKITAANSNNTIMIRTLALAEQIANDDYAALNVLNHYLPQNLESEELMMAYLEATDEPRADIIEQFYHANADNTEDDWMTMIQPLWYGGHYKSVSRLLDVLNEHAILVHGYEYYIITLYMAERYNDLVDTLTTNQADRIAHSPTSSSTIALTYALSLLRLRRKKKAKEFIGQWIQYARNVIYPSPSARLQATGVKYYMFLLMDSLDTLTKKELNRFDPFVPTNSEAPFTF